MATNHGHGEEPVLGAVNPEALAAGHEPDNTFAVKPIMAIPLAVVVTFVIAFSVAAGAFAYFRSPEADKFAHPAAVASAAKGTNDRLDAIERAEVIGDPKVMTVGRQQGGFQHAIETGKGDVAVVGHDRFVEDATE